MDDGHSGGTCERGTPARAHAGGGASGTSTLTALRRLHDVGSRLGAGDCLDLTMQAVVDGVVAGLGFGVAVTNLRLDDGAYEVIAVAGPGEVRSELLGRRTTAAAFDAEFALAEHWGRLRFVPHEAVSPDEAEGWVPTIEVVDAPDAWHPLDALFAPLTGPGGDVVGILSVDLPHDGRRPGPRQRELLELFALQAGIAIDTARLRDRLRAERHELRQERDRLHLSESAFRLAFEGAGNGMAIAGLDAAGAGRLLRVNPAFCRLLARRPDELLLGGPADFLHAEDLQAAEAALADVAAGRRSGDTLQSRVRRPDGTTVWLGVSCAVIGGKEGQDRLVLLTAEDVTARLEREARLRHDAEHDPLTGLPNRVLLARRLDAAAERTARTGLPGAVLFCDLDGFKQVNDRYGHAAGDRVLRLVAERLLVEVRSRDTVARLGGDEFVILVEDLDAEGVAAVAERVRRAVAAPLDGVGVAVTMSVGVTPLGTADGEELLRRADAAMYHAKAQERALRAAGTAVPAPRPPRRRSPPARR